VSQNSINDAVDSPDRRFLDWRFLDLFGQRRKSPIFSTQVELSFARLHSLNFPRSGKRKLTK